MKSKILFTVFAFLMLLMPGVYALEFVGNCTDANTLVLTLNYTVGNDETFIQEAPITCPFGCSENQGTYGDICSLSPEEQNAQNSGTAVAISIILSLISIAFIYISLNLNPDNQILGWFFLPVSLFIMTVNIFLLTKFTVDVGIISILSVTGYAVIIAAILVIAYFMLFILTKGWMKVLRQKVEKNRFGERSGV